MTDKTPAQQLAELPEPTQFTVVESPFFRHGASTFRAGNTYPLQDHPEITKAETFMFWRAGWVKVEGWPDPPARDPIRKIKLDIHHIKHLGKSPKLGA